MHLGLHTHFWRMIYAFPALAITSLLARHHICPMDDKAEKYDGSTVKACGKVRFVVVNTSVKLTCTQS